MTNDNNEATTKSLTLLLPAEIHTHIKLTSIGEGLNMKQFILKHIFGTSNEQEISKQIKNK